MGNINSQQQQHDNNEGCQVMTIITRLSQKKWNSDSVINVRGKKKRQKDDAERISPKASDIA